MHDHERRPLDALDGQYEAETPSHDAHPQAQLHGLDLAAANTREAGFLGQRIDVLLARGLSDPRALVELLERSTDEERAAVAGDRDLMDRLVDGCPHDALPAVLQLLVGDPKWALYHYLSRRGGRDPSAVRQLMAGATTDQKLEIVRWAALVGRLSEVFDGPDGLFGAALGQRVDAEYARGGDPRYAAFRAWRGARGGAFDLRAALTRMARDPAALAAGLRGAGCDWSRIVEHAPGDVALDPTLRAPLDRIALELEGLDRAQLLQAFELRFGVALDEGTGTALDVHGIRAVWRRLAPLDPTRVDRHTVERACRDPFGGAGWQVADFVDETTRTPDPPAAPPTEEGPEQPAPDREQAERKALLDAFVEACGGDGALRTAADATLDGRLDDAGWSAAVGAAAARGVLAVPADEVIAALRRLRDGAAPRISVAGPAAVPGARPNPEERVKLPSWLSGLPSGDREP